MLCYNEDIAVSYSKKDQNWYHKNNLSSGELSKSVFHHAKYLSHDYFTCEARLLLVLYLNTYRYITTQVLLQSLYSQIKFMHQYRWEVVGHTTIGLLFCKMHSAWQGLTHWGRDKMDAISQTIFSNVFSSMKMFQFRLKFPWGLFPRVQLIILQHWFR